MNTPTINVVELENKGRQMEAQRRNSIETFARNPKFTSINPDTRALADEAIDGGLTYDEFFHRWSQQTQATVPSTGCNANARIGMSKRQLDDYKVSLAIIGAVEGKLSGLEGECHQEFLRSEAGRGWKPRSERSVIIPFDVLANSRGPQGGFMTRDQLVGTPSLGGNLVQTTVAAGSFIEKLYAKMLVARMGAKFMPGLVGNVAIPRQTGGATCYWVSEGGAVTESSATFDQLALSPHELHARVDFSYRTLLQATPAIEDLVRSDISLQIALALDLAATQGSGGLQPTGLISVSGIGSVTAGTNGGVPTWANIVALETAVANANADMGSLGYLTNSKVRGKLKQVLKNSSATDDGFIWDLQRDSEGFGQMNGYRAGVSNQISSTRTAGTSTTIASIILFGDWSQLIVGLWGAVELVVNPYSQMSNRILEVHGYTAADVQVRHPDAFSAQLDALTS